jgi:hypothetical protein
VRVVVYTRASTGRQADEGLGLVEQERGCRAWAREHGYWVAGVYREEAVSGTKDLEDRVALAGVAFSTWPDGWAEKWPAWLSPPVSGFLTACAGAAWLCWAILAQLRRDSATS